MEISDAKFTEFGTIEVILNGERSFVPDDLDNSHRMKIAEWEAEGNVIEPYVPEELTIEQKRALMPVKTPREFRDILIDEGVLTDAVPDEVTVKISEIPFDKERTKALNAWHNMTEARRDDVYIDMIGAMFGYTPEQIDALWLA